MRAPLSEAELLDNAAQIAGKTLRQIVRDHDLELPNEQRQNKGWAGQVLEIALGATASSRPEPDFQSIGVELKTLPIGRNGKPTESTFVCSINLSAIESCWRESLVRCKLARVLWLPVEADPKQPLLARRIGSAILWSPDNAQTAALKNDWQELTGMITIGKLEEITAHHGQYLQIRPKAANAKSLGAAIDSEGEIIRTLPRGFYLRPCFTRQVLEDPVP